MNLTKEKFEEFEEIYRFLIRVVEEYEVNIKRNAWVDLSRIDKLYLYIDRHSIELLDPAYENVYFSMPIESLFFEGDVIEHFREVKRKNDEDEAKRKEEKLKKDAEAQEKREQTLLETLAEKFGYELRKKDA